MAVAGYGDPRMPHLDCRVYSSPGKELLLEILQLSTEGWLLPAKSWSETFLFVLLKDTDGNHS